MIIPKIKQMHREKQHCIRTRTILAALLIAAVIVSSIIYYTVNQETTLRIALFPYVPDQERFEQAVEAEWSERHPNVKLDFVSWDGYNEDPPEDLDIFVYDAVFFYDFLEKGYLLPIAEEDVAEVDDYFPYTLEVGKADGIIYALPQLLCTNLLYVRAEDKELANVRNIYELYQIIGDRSQVADPSTDEERLLMDMPDNISSALWYVEVQTDQEQSFSECCFGPGLQIVPCTAERKGNDKGDPRLLQLFDFDRVTQVSSARTYTRAAGRSCHDGQPHMMPGLVNETSQQSFPKK